MHLIYANRPSTPIAVVRSVTAPEAGALDRYAMGESSRQSEEIIRTAWHHRWWFACECRGAGAKPPLLYVHRSYSGHYSLAQMTDRPAHATGCPYGQRIRGVGATAESDAQLLPPLSQLFVRWFMAAKMNVVYPYTAQDKVTKQYASLRDVARSIAIDGKRQLHDFACTHANALPGLIQHLQRYRQTEKPSDVDSEPIWGVLLLVVDAIQEGRFSVGDRVVELAPHQIHMPVGTLDVGGPFAILLKYAANATGAFVPSEVYAQPVYSAAHLVPIDYAHERRTLKTLLRLQQKMLVDKDVVLVIRKTLSNTQAHNRGIAFQLTRLGPNGMPARELDVLTIDATHILDRFPAESQPDDIVYHLVKQDVPFHDLDKKFFGILFARLLDGVQIKSRSQQSSVNAVPSVTIRTR
ncbi:MAG: hypothetical protein ACR2PS_08730 [Pseudomonadales bacterium]